MKALHLLPPLCIILFCAAPLAAQQDIPGKKISIFEALTTREGELLRLETDFTFFENPPSKEKFSAVLSTENRQSFRLYLEKRGKFRLRGGALPPLKMNFSKKELEAAGLNEFDEIKLVLPYTLNKKGNELIVREYLAYRLFEHLSPYSFRARLIQLELEDVHAGRQHLVYAILLEDKEELAGRLGGALIKTYNHDLASYDSRQLALMSTFQYLIGNADWDLNMNRNICPIQIPGSNLILAIPYDFDFSGLVNAPYAYPSTASGLVSVRDRQFRIENLPEADLDHASQQIRPALDAFFQATHAKDFLTRQAQKDIYRYLESFFRQIPSCKTVNCLPEAELNDNWSMND